MWQDLAKFRHFCKILWVYFERLFRIWRNSSRTSANFVGHWANIYYRQLPNYEINLAIWSHWYQTLILVCGVTSLGYFWKLLLTNFPTEDAQISSHFWGSFEKSSFLIKLHWTLFQQYFGTLVPMLLLRFGYTIQGPLSSKNKEARNSMRSINFRIDIVQ